MDVLINRNLDAYQSCYIAYSIPLQQLYLVGDDGNIHPAPVSNNQCSVSLVSTNSNGTTFTLTVSYTFTTAFGTQTGRGDKILFAGASDSNGWTTLGTWRVWAPPSPPPTPFVSSIETSNSVQAHQLLTAKFNAAGASSAGQILVNSAINAINACYLTYYAGRYLILVANDGYTLLSPAFDFDNPQGFTTVSNSQCTLNAATRTTFGNS